jgi:hypothetical protein
MKWQIRGKDVIPGTINFGVVHASILALCIRFCPKLLNLYIFSSKTGKHKAYK